MFQVSEDQRRVLLRGLGVAAITVLACAEAAPLAQVVPMSTTFLITTAICVSLLLHPRRPALVTAATFVLMLSIGSLWPLLAALYLLAAQNRTKMAVGFAGAAVVMGTLLTFSVRDAVGVTTAGPQLLIALAVVSGLWAHSRARHVAALQDRVRLLRQERELLAEQGRQAERARLAAEMHDVLAHRLSLLVLHTGVLTRRPDQVSEPVRERLALVRDTAVTALGELRDLLGVLRTAQPGTQAPPGPTVRDFEDLLSDARAAGQSVRSMITGDPQAVPTTVRLATQRLVLESLTNARKHAYGAPVELAVDYGAKVSVVVANGPGRSQAGTTAGGHGLAGMAERVAALSGSLTAAPQPCGGFVVKALIPTALPTGAAA